jgi:hypothetical protein
MASNKVQLGQVKRGQRFSFKAGSAAVWVIWASGKGKELTVAHTRECNFKRVPATRNVYVG